MQSQNFVVNPCWIRASSAWIVIVFMTATCIADTPSLMRMFGRTGNVAADPAETYLLTEEDGPWLILAHTFVGEGSEQRAQRLVLEIRQNLNLQAFVHKRRYDDLDRPLDSGPPVQTAGARATRTMRYANEIRYDAHAVLVGEYDRVDHPQVDDDLQRIKTASSAVLGDEKEMAAENDMRNPVTAVKAMHRQWISRRGDKRFGPMAGAFVTRNPMLPEDYFQAPQVDSFVAELNESMPHSLLKCEGKFTVIVRTFEGLGTIVGARNEDKFVPSINRLDECAAQAGKMTKLLREKGHEAYQFHDRHKSIVTIGSFESLGRALPNGQFQYDEGILRIMNEFRAFNVDPKIVQQVAQKTQKGVAANAINDIPFDVQPTPIAVPKASKRSFISASR